MRKLALILGLAFALTSAPALAGGLDFDVTVANAKAGTEAVLTAPAAPLLGLIHGDPVLGLPFAPVTDRAVGLVTGSVGGAFSVITGAVDLLFALPASLVGIPPVSPEPVVDLF